MIAGYTRGNGHRADSFGALVLAEPDAGGLRYVGNVGTGFGDAEIARLLALLKPLQPKLAAVRRDAEAASHACGRRAVGGAAARRTGPVRRVDA